MCGTFKKWNLSSINLSGTIQKIFQCAIRWIVRKIVNFHNYNLKSFIMASFHFIFSHCCTFCHRLTIKEKFVYLSHFGDLGFCTLCAFLVAKIGRNLKEILMAKKLRKPRDFVIFHIILVAFCLQKHYEIFKMIFSKNAVKIMEMSVKGEAWW